MSHKLFVCKEARPVAQKKRRMSEVKKGCRCFGSTKAARAKIHKGNSLHHVVDKCGVSEKEQRIMVDVH